MRRYLIIGLRSAILFIAISVSLALLLSRKLLRYAYQQPGSITGSNPFGPQTALRKASKWVSKGVGKIRGLIASYIRDHHPTVWHRFRNYLRERG